MNGNIIIAVSKLSQNYADWLNKISNQLDLIDCYSLSDISEIQKLGPEISGILLSGGVDINPSLYGKPEELIHCGETDRLRDEIETLLVAMSIQQKIPVLGICRGQQILNIARNGTLYTDIQQCVNSSVIHRDHEDVFHPVTIRKETQLYRIAKTTRGMVNSAHHQAIEHVSNEFIVSAECAEDGIIEAIEFNGIDHPFCMAVQWHPERMDIYNPLSGLIGKAFIEKSRERRILQD